MTPLLLDRPAVAGDPFLLHAFARRRRPLSASDLIRAMSGTGVALSDVIEGLARARTRGLLGVSGFRGDRMLYELTDEGRELLAADRAV